MANWVIIIGKSLILIILLFLMTKGLGKRQLAQLTIFEYISGIVLGGIVAIHSSTMKYTFSYGLIAMFIWFLIPLAVDLISLKNKVFKDFVQGKSTIFIKNGKVLERNLKKEGYTADELLEQLRYKNIFNLADVEFALLEPSGMVNVLPKKETLPPTINDLGLNLPSIKEPQTVIIDGQIINQGLNNLSLSHKWLELELKKSNVKIENVFLGQVDDTKQLTIDLFDDTFKYSNPHDFSLLNAQIKKCQADLDLFALTTNKQLPKKMYNRNRDKLKHVIQMISPHLND